MNLNLSQSREPYRLNPFFPSFPFPFFFSFPFPFLHYFLFFITDSFYFSSLFFSFFLKNISPFNQGSIWETYQYHHSSAEEFWIHEILGSPCLPPICHTHLVWQGRHNMVWFFSTPLLQEHLDAATWTPGTQGGLLIYTPAQGKALCPPGIGQSAGTLICMHPLRRGWRQIRASACAVVLFTATVYRKLAPSFRPWLLTTC